MGTSHRIAAVAAVAHAKNFYNHTQPAVAPNTDATHYTVNIFFISATLCGVLVAVCAACWRRKPRLNKPENVAECGVYTVASDARLGQQLQLEEVAAGPPPAYETVVEGSSIDKDSSILQDVLTEPCPKCTKTTRVDSGLPSYEAAVFLRDTKL